MRGTERRHDLPPAWDGHPVTWGPWHAATTTLRFHLELHELACEACGSLEEQLVATGRRAAGDVDQVVEGGRVVLSDADTRLYAFRCPDCGHDQVLEGDELWDLDETDYGDDGSRPPVPPSPHPTPVVSAPAAATPQPDPHGDLRTLPAPEHARSFCHGCGRLVVWATTVAGPNGPGGKLQPFDPREDLAGNVAITQPVARGRLLARALHKDEQVERPLEYSGMTHFATCPVKARPAPPMTLLEHQTKHLTRRRTGGRR